MSSKLLMNNIVSVEPPPSGTYQQVLGMTPLKVDNTVVGELEEVEILGNTWQDRNFLIPRDITTSQQEGKECYSIRGDTTPRPQNTLVPKNEMKDGETYTIFCESKVVSKCNNFVLATYDGKDVIPIYKHSTIGSFEKIKVSFVYKRNYALILVTGDVFGQRNYLANLMIVEGDHTREDSYTPDYSNIKHLGELQPDGKYKIVVSCKDGAQSNVNSQTLFLEQPLMKIRDIQDRLFYDKSKGEYVIEKNIIARYLKDLNLKPNTQPTWDGGKCYVYGIPGQFKDANISNQFSTISNYYWKGYEIGRTTDKDTCGYDASKRILIKMDAFEPNNPDKVEEWVNQNNPCVYAVLTSPQLIPTGIKQEMKLSSYDETTHLLVEGGLNGGIKANIPVIFQPIQDGLIYWWNANDYDGNGIWTDRISNKQMKITSAEKNSEGVYFNKSGAKGEIDSLENVQRIEMVFKFPSTGARDKEILLFNIGNWNGYAYGARFSDNYSRTKGFNQKTEYITSKFNSLDIWKFASVECDVLATIISNIKIGYFIYGGGNENVILKEFRVYNRKFTTEETKQNSDNALKGL